MLHLGYKVGLYTIIDRTVLISITFYDTRRHIYLQYVYIRFGMFKEKLKFFFYTLWIAFEIDSQYILCKVYIQAP